MSDLLKMEHVLPDVRELYPIRLFPFGGQGITSTWWGLVDETGEVSWSRENNSRKPAQYRVRVERPWCPQERDQVEIPLIAQGLNQALDRAFLDKYYPKLPGTIQEGEAT